MDDAWEDEPLADAPVNPLCAETLFCLCSYHGKLLPAGSANAILLEVPTKK